MYRSRLSEHLVEKVVTLEGLEQLEPGRFTLGKGFVI